MTLDVEVRSDRKIAIWARQIARLVAIMMVAIALMTMPARYWWLSDLIANLRIQLLIGLILAIISTLIVRETKVAAAVLLVAAWQASWLSSAVAPARKSASAHVLTVCTVNVLTHNVQYDRIIAALNSAAPDVIAIMELGSGLEQRLIMDLGEIYPYRIMQSDDAGNFGIGLISKVPIEDAELFYLSEPRVPSIGVSLTCNDSVIHLIATHPIPPVTPGYFRARNDHLNRLANRIRTIRGDNKCPSIVLVGDLNLTPWSPIFADFINASELTDATRGDGTAAFAPTWYLRPGFPFGLVLDHGFVSSDLICSKRTVLADVGSDHRPVVLEISTAR